VLPDTAAIAAAWIEANLPRGTRIFAEPIPLALSEASIVREQQLKVAAPRRGYGYRDETEHFFDLQRRAVRMRGGLDITWIRFPRGFYMEGSGKGYEEEWLTPEFMASQMGDLDRYDCVLVSEYGSVRFGDPGKLPGRFRFMGRFYRRLAGRGRLVKRFVPLPGESQGGIYLLYDLRARSDR
ncbi:MAG: hypothetical protein NT045_05250, partial [Candidatus Aureabacteria bacterium]|nr:hypothetical protein [Candidatus Auribacterota bacterium]